MLTFTYQWLTSERLSETDIGDINRLLFQLTQKSRILDMKIAQEVAQNSSWIVVRDEQRHIVGMGVLTVLHIPTRTIGSINDVVVDESLRGQGIGKKILQCLINKAKTEGVLDRIDLTSKPLRTEANKLYHDLGFEQRETNHYVLELKS